MLKTIFTSVIALMLIPAVMVSATHAKDIASYGLDKAKVLGATFDNVVHKKVAVDDPMTKSLGDLHNHTDKTMLKHTMVKTTGDAATQAARREVDDIAKEHPLSIALLEMLLSLRLTFAWAIAR